MSNPLFTVFTPTYNRAHTLHRVYDSLCAQTLRDFEWLVVDDGSIDNTRELVASWAKTADFAVRYFWQENSGKHIAHNLAVGEARGEFFTVLDSDDACVPRALERFAYYWNAIPARDRSYFAGVGALCRDQKGDIVGDHFPTDAFDASTRDLTYRYRVRGEKWGTVRTAILQRYAFPEIGNTMFVPEGLLWLQIGKIYKWRYFNEVLRIYYIDDQQTGATLTRNSSIGTNAPGRLEYYLWILNNDLEFFLCAPAPFLRAAIMLPILASFSGRSLWSVLRSLERPAARALVVLALPFTAILYGRSRLT